MTSSSSSTAPTILIDELSLFIYKILRHDTHEDGVEMMLPGK